MRRASWSWKKVSPIALAALVATPLAAGLAVAAYVGWHVWTYDPDAPWEGEAPDVQAALAAGREPDRAIIEQYARQPATRIDLRIVLAHHDRLDLLAPYDGEIPRSEEAALRWLAHEGIKVTRMHRGAVVTVREGGVTSTYHAFAYTGRFRDGSPCFPERGWLTAIVGPMEDTPHWPAMTRTHAGGTTWSQAAIEGEFEDFAALTDTLAPPVIHVEMLDDPPPLVP